MRPKPFEPSDVYALLRDHHLVALSREQQGLLAARSCGWTSAEISERTFRSARTISALIERLEDLTCIPSGANRDAWVTGFWFGLHVSCSKGCAAVALRLIAENAVFAAISGDERSR